MLKRIRTRLSHRPHFNRFALGRHNANEGHEADERRQKGNLRRRRGGTSACAPRKVAKKHTQLHGAIEKPHAQGHRRLSLLGKSDRKQIHQHLNERIKSIPDGVGDKSGPQTGRPMQYKRYDHARNRPAEQPRETHPSRKEYDGNAQSYAGKAGNEHGDIKIDERMHTVADIGQSGLPPDGEIQHHENNRDASKIEAPRFCNSEASG